MQVLAPRYRVIAPGFYGAGQTPAWPGQRELRLDDATAEFSLVGHSYGAAVAAKAALKHGRRVRALVIHEPVLFNLLIAMVATAPKPGRFFRCVPMSCVRPTPENPGAAPSECVARHSAAGEQTPPAGVVTFAEGESLKTCVVTYTWTGGQ